MFQYKTMNSIVLIIIAGGCWNLTLGDPLAGQLQGVQIEFDDPLDDYEDKLRINFMKALETFLVETKLKESAKLLMEGIKNHQLEKDGSWTYVTTSMLRSVGSPASIQISSMLNLISNSAPAGSKLGTAAKVIQEYLQLPQTKKLRLKLNREIKDLFRPVDS